MPVSRYAMPSDEERKLYLDGIHLFNDHEFFEAHEVWEDIWHMACGLKHEFYQGMIQCAVALEHYRRSNPRGVLSLYSSYTAHFKDIPPIFMGLDVRSFLGRMRETLEPVLTANPVPERGAIELDPQRVPKIALQYDPFETGEAQQFNSPGTTDH